MKQTSVEHLILDALYQHSNIVIVQSKTPKGTIPLYNRKYTDHSFHFGFIVDFVNSPEKYKHIDILTNPIENINPTVEEIKDSKYSYKMIADAIEVLLEYKHVEETQEATLSDETIDRKLRITKDGILAYRRKFHIKQIAEELFVQQGYDIQKRSTSLRSIGSGLQYLHSLLATLPISPSLGLQNL